MRMMKKEHTEAQDIDSQLIIDRYEELREKAQRDALTGLLNRGAIEKEINERLENMSDTDDCALFIIDLDNFKMVNDTLGHQTGDMVLQRVSKCMSSMFRATDIVGRLGGDEFVIFLSGGINEDAVRRKGHALCDQLQFSVGTRSQILVSASVGIHISHGGNFENIYQAADLALYKAKKSGKQCYCLTRSEKGVEEIRREAYTPVNAVRLQSLLDHIDSGVTMIRMSDPLSFIYVSPAFVKMLHMETEQVANSEVMSFVHPDDREELQELLRTTVKERRETVSHVVRIIGGRSRMMWWRIHVSCVEYEDNEYVALVTVVDISDLKEKEKYLAKDKNLFQTAMEHAAQGIWELDMTTKEFRLVGRNSIFPDELSQSQQFPEDLIKKRWIHPEGAEGFRVFAREIFAGKMQGYANFKVHFLEGDGYRWASFSYRVVLDSQGIPKRVVGIIESMTGDGAYYGRKSGCPPLPDSLMPSWVLRVCGNLTKDTVQSCWIEGKDVSGTGIYQTCTEILTAERGKAFTPERGERFSMFLSREALLVNYLEEHTRWIMHEYRRTDQGGNIQWVLCVIHLYQEEAQKDVEFRMLICKMSFRHRWESQFGISIYKDPETLLYTRATASELARRLIEIRKQEQCAFVIVEISGRHRLQAQEPGLVDQQWKALLTALMVSVGTDCIPGQFGTDRYSLFYPRVKSEEAIKRRLEQAFQFIRGITADHVDVSQLRFSAVGVCRYNTETEYGVLEKLAMDQSQLWSNASGDKVIFASEKKEMSEQLWSEAGKDHVGAIAKEQRRPLSDREKDVAIKIMMDIIHSDSIAEAVKGMLRSLGEHYNADRVYLLVPTEQGRVVIMPYEWTSNEKHSIQKAVSGMLLERIPLLERCTKENSPVFLTRELQPNASPSSKKAEAWRFAVFPMKDNEQLQAYLCIENAREYKSDAVLAELLISCILKERSKYIKNGALKKETEQSFEKDLPNYSSFIENM